MPARSAEENALLERIENPAVKPGVEPLLLEKAAEERYLQQALRSQIMRPVGQRSPARHEDLIGIEHKMNAPDVSKVPEDVVAVESPVIEYRGNIRRIHLVLDTDEIFMASW